MQVKSITECSMSSILQFFRPSLSYHLSLISLFCLFLNGRFTQVLLYMLTVEYELKLTDTSCAHGVHLQCSTGALMCKLYFRFYMYCRLNVLRFWSNVFRTCPPKGAAALKASLSEMPHINLPQPRSKSDKSEKVKTFFY